jgi:glutathione S-transferase
VPTIDDDGFVMWESMYQWAYYIANDVEPNMITVMQHRVMFPPEKRNPALADDADAKLQPKLKVLDGHLAMNRSFGADKWDMADFMVASVCYSLVPMKYDLGSYPSFQKWLMSSIERPKAREARALRE